MDNLNYKTLVGDMNTETGVKPVFILFDEKSTLMVKNNLDDTLTTKFTESVIRNEVMNQKNTELCLYRVHLMTDDSKFIMNPLTESPYTLLVNMSLKYGVQDEMMYD